MKTLGIPEVNFPLTIEGDKMIMMASTIVSSTFEVLKNIFGLW
jgi:hypothetical protein